MDFDTGINTLYNILLVIGHNKDEADEHLVQFYQILDKEVLGSLSDKLPEEALEKLKTINSEEVTDREGLVTISSQIQTIIKENISKIEYLELYTILFKKLLIDYLSHIEPSLTETQVTSINDILDIGKFDYNVRG